MLRQAGINRREVVQSRVLTVVEVMALESFLIAGVGNKYDLYAAGVFLFLLYARARVSDIRFINSFTIDVTGSYWYLEAKTSDHKSRRLASALGLHFCLSLQ